MLFNAGVIFGSGWSNSTLPVLADQVGSFVGGITTLVALVFAVSTVNEWKKQKPHELIVENLHKLEAALAVQ